MRNVYMVSGGITKFAKAHPETTFQYMVKEAFDYAMHDVPNLAVDQIDGSVGSYFSDHFTRQLMAGIMVHDYLGLCPKPSKRIEGGGATGGSVFRAPGRRSPRAGWTSAWPSVLRPWHASTPGKATSLSL